ncbi:hypothetical protein VTO73DRAFT_2401 [Trametes versicolor]
MTSLTLNFPAEVATRSFARHGSDSSTSGSDGTLTAYPTSIYFALGYRGVEINEVGQMLVYPAGGQSRSNIDGDRFQLETHGSSLIGECACCALPWLCTRIPGNASSYRIVDRAHFRADEVTIQWRTSGDTSVEEAQCAGVRHSKWEINRAEAFIDAGGYMTMMASKSITEDVKR